MPRQWWYMYPSTVPADFKLFTPRRYEQSVYQRSMNQVSPLPWMKVKNKCREGQINNAWRNHLATWGYRQTRGCPNHGCLTWRTGRLPPDYTAPNHGCPTYPQTTQLPTTAVPPTSRLHSSQPRLPHLPPDYTAPNHGCRTYPQTTQLPTTAASHGELAVYPQTTQLPTTAVSPTPRPHSSQPRLSHLPPDHTLPNHGCPTYPQTTQLPTTAVSPTRKPYTTQPRLSHLPPDYTAPNHGCITYPPRPNSSQSRLSQLHPRPHSSQPRLYHLPPDHTAPSHGCLTYAPDHTAPIMSVSACHPQVAAEQRKSFPCKLQWKDPPLSHPLRSWKCHTVRRYVSTSKSWPKTRSVRISVTDNFHRSMHCIYRGSKFQYPHRYTGLRGYNARSVSNV